MGIEARVDLSKRAARAAERARVATDAIVEALQVEDNVMGAYLFGSSTKGEAGPDSDLDLGLLFTEPVGWDVLVDLQNRLEEIVGLPIDVIDAGRCDPFLALDIVRGERLFCRNATICDEFDLFVLRRAGDLAPFERERRRMALEPGARQRERGAS